MRSDKTHIFIILINLFLSLLIVYISPRLDILTFLCFILANAIIFFFLALDDRYKRNKIKSEIEGMFSLLHSVDTDVNGYEAADDAFGGLRDEIIKVVGENKIAADKAVKNEQILREYTEDIAHQIKTPLTGILLMLDLLEEDEENKAEYLGRVRYSTNRLYQLTDILLKLAALDSGSIKMKKETVGAKALIEEAAAELEILFANRELIIPVFGQDFKLVCDRKWTYEAVFNILKNGMEASKEEGVEVYLKETNIYQSIIIKDFGSGISDEALKKVYKRFYKENKDSKGYGIGLPMAKTIIEKQNGELLYSRGKMSNCFELRFYR